MKKMLSLLIVIACAALAQKEYVVSSIPYTVADSWNVEIKLSPGFLTEINFPSPIRNPGSGDFGLYELIGKEGDTSIWLRPKAAFSSTDLWVLMEDGKTAIFYITYDDKTKMSRKYVPADTVTERQLTQDSSTPSRKSLLRRNPNTGSGCMKPLLGMNPLRFGIKHLTHPCQMEVPSFPQ
jgi:hypothetical protein